MATAKKAQPNAQLVLNCKECSEYHCCARQAKLYAEAAVEQVQTVRKEMTKLVYQFSHTKQTPGEYTKVKKQLTALIAQHTLLSTKMKADLRASFARKIERC